MVSFNIDIKDISYIKMFKGDELYDDYRNMPNANVIDEGTDDEYIIFYTINGECIKQLIEGVKDEVQRV